MGHRHLDRSHGVDPEVEEDDAIKKRAAAISHGVGVGAYCGFHMAGDE